MTPSAKRFNFETREAIGGYRTCDIRTREIPFV